VNLLPGKHIFAVGMVCHVGKAEDRSNLIQATLDSFGGLDVLGDLLDICKADFLPGRPMVPDRKL